MVDAFATLNVVDLLVDDDLTVTDDVAIGGLATIGETLAVTGVLTTTAATVFNGGFASNADSTMGTNKKLIFRDSAIHISSTADGDLSIAADDEIDITSTLIDVNGNLDVSGTALVTGVLTTTAATVFNGGFASNAASTITVADNSDNLTLTSTDADAVAGPNLRLYRNSSSPADSDILGTIHFEGRNDNSQDVLYADLTTQAVDVSDGSEDGNFFINTMTAGTLRNRANFYASGVVFNEESLDLDFRVESNGNANMLFVDGGSDHVNIGTSSDLGGVLNVLSSDNTDTLVVYSDDADNNAGPNIRLWRNSSSPADNDGLGKILFSGEDSADAKTDYASIKAFALDVTNGTEDGELTLTTILAGAEANRLDFNSTATIFNESSNDLDFRIESNGAVNKFFVDGAEDIISIGGGESYLVGGFKNSLQVVGTGATTSSISVTRNSNDVNPPYINFGKTRGAIGSVTAVNNNDEVGRLAWHAADGTDVASEVCRISAAIDGSVNTANDTPGRLMFATTANGNNGATERMRITEDGIVLIGETSANAVSNGTGIYVAQNGQFYASSSSSHFFNKQADGDILFFRSAGQSEGVISIDGSTTTYTGFSGRHESSGIPTNTPVGTVVSTIDALDVYPDTQLNPQTEKPEACPKAGQTRADHAKVEVSTSEGDACVYGVVAEFTSQDKLIVTSVGIGSVRVTGACSKGDLLESKGDGTAKVQSDDIVRSKTLGKVTIGNSNTGVKLVPCVMYCG